MATKKATSSRAIKGVKSRIQAARDLINSNSRRVNNARRTGSAKSNATTAAGKKGAGTRARNNAAKIFQRSPRGGTTSGSSGG